VGPAQASAGMDQTAPYHPVQAGRVRGTPDLCTKGQAWRIQNPRWPGSAGPLHQRSGAAHLGLAQTPACFHGPLLTILGHSTICQPRLITRIDQYLQTRAPHHGDRAVGLTPTLRYELSQPGGKESLDPTLPVIFVRRQQAGTELTTRESQVIMADLGLPWMPHRGAGCSF